MSQNNGHRERLRQRFQKVGAEGMQDYELLELLLFFVNPRQDTKPIAKRLLTKFGSLNNILKEQTEALEEVEGIGEKASLLISVVHQLQVRVQYNKLINRPVFKHWQDVLLYLQQSQGFGKIEQLRLLFLNKAHKLLMEDVHQWGTVDETPIYPREVVKTALFIGASGVIMVHNHPSGKPEPSDADKHVTESIKKGLSTVNISLLDHLIVAENRVFSFKQQNLL